MDKWSRMCAANIAASGKFSSDRTIAEYAKDIWDVEIQPNVKIPAPNEPLFENGSNGHSSNGK